MAYGGSHEDMGQAAGAVQYPLTDAHAHIGGMAEIEERLRSRIPSMICAGCPQEAERLDEIQARPESGGILIPTYGLHPWHADRASLEEMQPFLQQAQIIGEIGMDSVWCAVPLDVQREVFTSQLFFAMEHHRSVILHTKGQEREIADIIRRYPNTYLVHWYSSEEHLEEYLDLDCYFSIGSDVWWNPAVRKLAQRVPVDRILIETDGMGAVRWAYEEAETNKKTAALPPVPSSLEEALGNTLETVAAIRQRESSWLAKQVQENFLIFSGVSK